MRNLGNSYIEYLVFAAVVGLATVFFLYRLQSGGDVRYSVEGAYDSLQQKVLGY